MDNKNVPPSVGEFAIGERDQLLARVAELEREAKNDAIAYRAAIERQNELRTELSALKQPSAGVDERAARVIGYRPGMSEVTLLIDGGSVPAWMNIGDTVHISEQARAQLAAPAGVPADVFCFEYQHAFNKEKRTVCITRKEVAEGMEDTLFEKLSAQICQCEPVGETNVVDCNCCDYAEDFDLLAAAPSPAPACEECGKPEQCFDCAVAEVSVMTAPASDVAPYPKSLKMEPYQTVDKGSTNYKAGWNAAIKAMEASDVVQVPRELPDLAAQLCDVLENKNDMSLNKWALKSAYLVGKIRALLNGGRS